MIRCSSFHLTWSILGLLISAAPAWAETWSLTNQERARVPCIGRQRAYLVVAGCAILEAICRTWPVGWLRVADRGLREGILFNMMGPCVAEKLRWAPNPRAAAKPRLAATPSAIAGSCSPCMAGGCGAAG